MLKETKFLRQKKSVVLYQENIFLTSKIISVGDFFVSPMPKIMYEVQTGILFQEHY